MDKKIEDLINELAVLIPVLKSKKNIDSPTIIKTEKAEITADELIFLNIYSQLDPIKHENSIYENMLDISLNLFEIETAALLLMNKEGGDPVIKYAKGDIADRLLNKKISGDNKFIKMTLSMQDVQCFMSEDPEISALTGREIRSLLLCPLVEQEKPFGLIMLINKKDNAGFRDEDMRNINLIEDTVSKFYYFFEKQIIFNTIAKQKNDVRDIKDISRTDLSYKIADLSAKIIQLYNYDNNTIDSIIGITDNLIKILKHYY